MNFQLTEKDLRTALERLAVQDQDIARALDQVDFPAERRQGPPSFENLLRVIVGQQLSVKAATTIFGRIQAALADGFEPEAVVAMSDERLRSLGLSRPKIRYTRGLCEAILDGSLDPATWADLPDEVVAEQITRLTGFGRWSAEMILLFSLGRPDVWPADDLAIQAGVHRLKGLPERPNRRQTDAIAEPWRPYRGAVAIFVWHYYARTPMG